MNDTHEEFIRLLYEPNTFWRGEIGQLVEETLWLTLGTCWKMFKTNILSTLGYQIDILQLNKKEG